MERAMLRLIQHEGGDRSRSRPVRFLLVLLKGCSKLFTAITVCRAWLFENGFMRRYPLGCQVVSVGNVTVGGTGKTPVVEALSRMLSERGRKVAILSRGYRKKELSRREKRALRGKYVPPRVVSDGSGRPPLITSEFSGDEPWMLASNLPNVAVIVDKDRVKSGRYAIRHFGSDVLVLDDGFQYMKLKHSHEIVLVDYGNPFGNGHLLPRGILREPARNIRRADFIFITKVSGDTAALRSKIRKMNPNAPIAECRHRPRYYKDAYGDEIIPLEAVRGMKVVSLSGIAAPMSFETSIRRMGAQLVGCERFSDHYRYRESDILEVLDSAAEQGAEAVFTTEKDAVRLPPIKSPHLPIYYMRMEIEITDGEERFREYVDKICFHTME